MALTYPVKLEFKDYPSGSWQDWSQYIVDAPATSQRVESDNEGEAGVIVFDSASITLRYESGNPVYNAFSIDLTEKQRYLFRISFLKSDKTYEQRMEGMADFSTIEWPENEQNVISFEIVDKLSALGILYNGTVRNSISIWERLPVSLKEPAINVMIGCYRVSNIDETFPFLEEYNIIISQWIGVGQVFHVPDQLLYQPGEIVIHPDDTDTSLDEQRLALVIDSWIETSVLEFEALGYYYNQSITYNRVKILCLDSSDRSLFWNHPEISIYDGHQFCHSRFIPDTNAFKYYEKNYYGIDLGIYETENGRNILKSYDGLKIIHQIIKNQWPEITLINLTGDSSYPIPLEYFSQLINEKPFEDDLLPTLMKFANSMDCYVYINKAGNVVVQKKANNGTTRNIGTTKILRRRKKLFWDKLVDGVTIKAKSWILDSNGDFLESEINQTKELYPGSGISISRPKNSKTFEILINDPAINTSELLDSFAAQKAVSMLNFYGLRRHSYELELKLDDNTIQWELVDNIEINGTRYFFTALDVDPAERIVSLEAVEVEGHEFDFRQIVVGLSESNFVNGFSGTGSASTVNVSIEGNYNFVPPLILTEAEVSIKNMALDTGDILALRKGTTPQEFRIYNTYPGSVNNEFISLGFKKNANVFTIESEKNGTGIKRDIAVVTDQLRISYDIDNYLGIKVDNTGCINLKPTGNIIEQRNGTNAQELRIFNTYTDADNNEYFSIGYRKNSNLITFESEKNGSGTIRNTSFLGSGVFGFGTTDLDGTPDAGKVTIKGSTNNGSTKILVGRDSDEANVFAVDTDGNVLINNTASYSWFNRSVIKSPVNGNLTISNTLLNDFGLLQFGGTTNLYPAIKRSTTEIHFRLADDSTDANIQAKDIKVTGNIGTTNFVSQLTGWRITNTGEADFRYIYTDELRAKSFISDLEQALAGSQIICKSVAKVAENYTPPQVGVAGTRLVVESFAGFETAAVFQNGDLIRLRQFSRTSGSLTIADAWGSVTLDTTYGSSGFEVDTKTQAYIFTRNVSVPGSASGAIKKGTLALDYGVSGNGFIESNATDGAWGANSPYTRIVTWTTAPDNFTLHNQTGKLSGITDNDFGGSLSGFGTYINGTSFIKGNIFVKASSQLSLQNNSIMIGNISGSAYNSIKLSQTGTTGTSGLFLYDGSGNELLKFALNGDRHIAGWNFAENYFFNGDSSKALVLNVSGTNFINQSSGIGFEVYNPSSPKVFIGNWSGNHLDWNITNSNKLTISGEIIGSVITGGIIQTNSPGNNPRIVINENNYNTIKFYNSNGVAATLSSHSTGPNSAGISIGNGYLSSENSGTNQGASFDYAIISLSKSLIGGVESNLLRSGQINLSNTADHTSIDLYADGTISSYCDIKFNPEGKFILPANDYDITLGNSNKKFLSIYVSEIRSPKLVVENVMATIGGRILIGQTNKIVAPIYDYSNTITVENQFTGSLPIICYLESVDGTNPKVEFIRIDSYNGMSAGGHWYNVTRNLDGTGANNWKPGDVVFNTGSTGSGFIDLYSLNSVKGGTQSGPAIVGNIRNSNTFNDWSEAWAIGNLGGLYGQSSGTFGVGLGKYTDNNSFVVITPSDGIQFKKRSSGNDSITAQWAANGTISIGNTGSYHTVINSTGLQLKSGSTINVNLNSSGLTLGNTEGSHINLTPGQLQLKNGSLSSVTIDSVTESILVGYEGSNLSNVYISTNGVKIRNNTTDKISLNSSGDILIGQTGAGQSNVFISSGTVQLRNNTTPVISLNSNGTGSFSGNITSSAVITGGTIQSAASGERMVIDNHITYYNTSGVAAGGLHYNPMDIDGVQLSCQGQLSLVAAHSDIKLDGVTVDIQASTFVAWSEIRLDYLNWGSKIYFGSALDTNLYRGGANLLKTDDSFEAGGDLIVNGTNLKAAKYFKLIDYDSGSGEVSLINRDGNFMFFSGGVAIGTYNDGVLGATGTGNLVVNNNIKALTYSVGANQVVSSRKTGWAAASGNATRTTFATSTVTTAQLAERVKALIDDLITHGLIGS